LNDEKTGFAFAFQYFKIEGDTINSTAMRLKDKFLNMTLVLCWRFNRN
jgi:hypothetical protein